MSQPQTLCSPGQTPPQAGRDRFSQITNSKQLFFLGKIQRGTAITEKPLPVIAPKMTVPRLSLRQLHGATIARLLQVCDILSSLTEVIAMRFNLAVSDQSNA
jgi:hypothetical protein